ncbi:DUF2752 domain-containing protein [Paenibacillus hodogayensis]|uniref:DUF2752 domain-containing protein n=1 Tax=Paenibacillus hodogayensis TaxID=279208 RepID=A0ABV5W1E2_9BACL
MLTNWYKSNPQRNTKLVWGISLGVGGLLYLKVWLPATQLGIPCLFHEITGLYCPGCGITRAAASLLQFRLDQAFQYNPLLFLLPPLYLIYAISTKKQKRLPGKVLMAVMLTVTFAFGICRNIPAFAWLAPIAVR